MEQYNDLLLIFCNLSNSFYLLVADWEFFFKSWGSNKLKETNIFLVFVHKCCCIE